MPDTMLDVRDLVVKFATPRGKVTAVNGVSFAVRKGATLGIVGESGCGKTVTSLSILRLIGSPGEIAGGQIIFDGRDILTLSDDELRKVRGDRIAMIFQEPMTALNPVFTVGNQIAEAVRLHRKVTKKEAYDQAIEALRKVGIPSPEKRVHEYPHQLSGGMRQRAMIAMAISCDPEILIADEPTTALDVTIQAQILDLMAAMKEEEKASMILITHDLGVVAQNCDDVVVMYAGKVVEEAPVKTLFANPAHPYTIGLLESIPSRQPNLGRLKEIPGMVPPLDDMPKGCSFWPRCPEAVDICREKEPPLEKVDSGALAACWLRQKVEV